jgi:hypothetical protein
VTSRLRESSGSWAIRGLQLGEAIGADIQLNAPAHKQKHYDAVIHVKRYGEVHGANAVLDYVDAWPQPAGNKWPFGKLLEYAKFHTKPFKHVIGATEWMAKDLQCGFHLRHHFRPDIEQNQIMGNVKWVGYEGSARYLEGWLPEILRQCEVRGWSFLVNPSRLADCDIVLSVRGAEWRGYGTDHWKSGVKLANAVGSGTPLIALPECGYKESGLPVEYVNSPFDLSSAFDAMTFERRHEIAQAYMRARPYYSLGAVASDLKAWLHHLKF